MISNDRSFTMCYELMEISQDLQKRRCQQRILRITR